LKPPWEVVELYSKVTEAIHELPLIGILSLAEHAFLCGCIELSMLIERIWLVLGDEYLLAPVTMDFIKHLVLLVLASSESLHDFSFAFLLFSA